MCSLAKRAPSMVRQDLHRPQATREASQVRDQPQQVCQLGRGGFPSVSFCLRTSTSLTLLTSPFSTCLGDELARLRYAASPRLFFSPLFAKSRLCAQQIFFLAGVGQPASELTKSPFVEKLHARGYEVLLLDQPMDEVCLQNLRTHESVFLLHVLCPFNSRSFFHSPSSSQLDDLPGRHQEGTQVRRRG